MQTIRMDMTEGIDREAMKTAGEILQRGGLVAFPTETVYGLGADALNPEASRKIYAAKGRPSDNPLIVHIADFAALEKIADPVPEKARALAEAFWPGPLTMIFNKKDIVPRSTTGGLDTVAVRMPSHPLAQELIRAGGGYIAAPSANTSGRPSPTRASHVLDDLDGKIDAVIDGGDVGIGLEATIVDLTEESPVILRPGYINRQMLEDVIGPVGVDRALIRPDEHIRPKAPGMKYRHYAPKASLTIVEGPEQAVTEKINELTEKALAEGKKAGIIATDESGGRYTGGIVKSVGKRSDEESIARHLYAVLREYDELDVSVIYSEAFETPRMGQAIMNRLLKAAGHQVIHAGDIG